MAIYHLTVKSISRSKGQSAIASAAYRRAECLVDKRYGEIHDYTAKGGVIHSELTIPDNPPVWIQELLELHSINPREAIENFWNLVEQTEKRKDAQVAREIEFALPVELTEEQNINLAREYIHDQFLLRGMVADWSVHWERGNPHVHVMLTLRELNENGFGLKVRDWNSKSLLQEWREKWAEYVNFHLAQHRHDVRIDYRSYKDQGIDLIPTIHQGRAVCDMDKRGIETQIMQEANSIRRENLKRIIADPSILFKKMTTQTTAFTRDRLAQEMGRYINDQGKFSTERIGVFEDEEPEVSKIRLSSFSPAQVGESLGQLMDGQGRLLTDDLAVLSKAALRDLKALEAKENTPVLTPESIAQLFKELEEHESVFSERHIAKALEPYTKNAEQFARALIEVKTSPDLLYLGAGDDGRDRFTTRQMFDLENRLQDIADTLNTRLGVKISDSEVVVALQDYQQKTGKNLTPEQEQAVRHILQPISISCIIGRAGTGKSYSLGAAKAVWEAAGLEVHGIALAGIAADGLSKGSGIESRTIESFRCALEKGQLTLSERSVVVMDEAGMTDSYSMLFVLEAVLAANAKIALVGDHAQLQPVGAGAVFKSLLERIGAKEISTIYRQREGWQKQATIDLALGNVGQAIDSYAAHHCVHLGNTSKATMQRLVDDWSLSRQTAQESIEKYLVVAYQNAHISQLNSMMRQKRTESNEIAEGYLAASEAGPIRIAKNDRLLFLKNKRRLGVSNGQFATIESVNFTETGHVIDFTAKVDGSNELVTINPKKYKNFTYGYAATVHKSQGATFKHVLGYVAGFGWNRHLTYVAATRHTDTFNLYADKETHRDLDALKKNLSRYGLKDSVLDFPLAFAERRGLDTQGLLKLLPKHLTQRLIHLRDGIVDRYTRLVDPLGYAKKTRKEKKAHRTAVTREQAREVAAYVDARREIGVAWEALNVRLKRFGLEKISYELADFALISATKEYITYQAAIAKRDALASPLAKTPRRFIKAFDIHAVDLSQLKKEAGAHKRREEVKIYLEFDKVGKIVLRDRQAAKMMHEISGNYRFLKEAGIDTSLFRKQALNHARRDLLRQLTPEERASFPLVQQYSLVSQEIGKLFDEHKNKSAEITAQLDLLRLEQEALAAKILFSRDVCGPSLDFFQIGRSKPHFGAVVSGTSMKQAESRWYKLQQAEARHVLRTCIQEYQDISQAGDHVSRDKLAAYLIENIKSYYPFLKAANIDTKVLRRQATQHITQQYLSTLNSQQQRDFHLVTRYQAISQQLGALFAEQSALTAETLHSREQIALLDGLNTERGEIAHRIMQSPARYRQTLHFHQIGLAAPLFTAENPSEQNQALAQNRYIKLQQAALRHAIQTRVQRYHTTLLTGDMLQRRQLAHDILADAKAHHGAVVKTAPLPSALWKTIREDAKFFVRDQFFATLSPEQQADFTLVENYISEQRSTAQAWREVLETKKSAALSTTEWQIHLLPLAQTPTHARNHLAAAIQRHPERFNAALDFFGIDIRSLDKAAYADLCHNYVNLYQRIPDRLTRSKLAHIICSDPKAHHSAVMSAGLQWKTIYKDQRLGERQTLFAGLSIEEKQLWRIAAEYQKINRKAARVWTQVFQAKNTNKLLHPKRKQTAELLTAKRDCLATKLRQHKQWLEFQNTYLGQTHHHLSLLREHSKINWEKVEKQASQHQKRVADIQQWQAAGEPTNKMLSHLTTPEGVLNREVYYHWLELNEEVSSSLQPIINNLNRYAYALQALGSSAQAVAVEQTQLNRLKQSLKQLDVEPMASTTMVDINIQKRVMRARRIEADTRPITGTLAERYLREHRSIQGTLQDSLRYHPGLYHGETKQTLPALVVVAKNDRQETMAVQAIFLDPQTANKAELKNPKLTYGTLSFENTGVLVNPGRNADTVALAEGTETALSIAEANPELRVYAVLGSNNFARAPIYPETKDVLICADNDGQNSASTQKIARDAEKIAARGVAVWQTQPTEIKQDFNDVLKQQGKNTVRAYLDNPTLLAEGVKINQLIQKMLKNKPSLKATLTTQESKTKNDITTPEQEERFIQTIKQYKRLKKSHEQNPSDSLTHQKFCLQAKDMAESYTLMNYIKARFPKMAKNLEALSTPQTSPQSKNAAIITEQEQRFIKAIKKYKKLKKSCEKNPFSSDKTDTLLAFTKQLVKHPKFMRYVQIHYPKMAKNIRSLSQIQSLVNEIGV